MIVDFWKMLLISFLLLQIHRFWGNFGISLCVAIASTLAFETPILILEKLLLGHGGSKSHKGKNIQTTNNDSEKTESKLPP